MLTQLALNQKWKYINITMNSLEQYDKLIWYDSNSIFLLLLLQSLINVVVSRQILLFAVTSSVTNFQL